MGRRRSERRALIDEAVESGPILHFNYISFHGVLPIGRGDLMPVHFPLVEIRMR